MKREITRQLELHLGQADGKRQILNVGKTTGNPIPLGISPFGTVTGIGGADLELPSEKKVTGEDDPSVQKFDRNFQPNVSYDAILMQGVLEHMADPQAAIRHAKDLLAPGGVLIATVPAFMSLWTGHDDSNHHMIRYRSDNFCPMFIRSGLRIRNSGYLFHWTCPVKMLISLKEKITGSRRTPTQVSAWVNRICGLLSRFEQATISRLPMPFGSSLMVVGTPED